MYKDHTKKGGGGEMDYRGDYYGYHQSGHYMGGAHMHTPPPARHSNKQPPY